jgi:radical SAM protein with 4Fe4S-binding SPASM domain
MKEDINLEEKYIVNPAYFIRMDHNRAILANKNRLELPVHFEDFFSYLHPFNAQLLTFFNGNDSLNEVINNISDFFDLPNKDVIDIVSEFIHNKKTLIKRYKDRYIYLPENLIIRRDEVSDFSCYNIEDFSFSSEPDFANKRLFIPLSINFQLTMNCYTDCIYCYANRKMQLGKRLSTDKIISLIEEAKSIGVVNFDINGGEVLLHPDSMEIISTLIKNNYHPYISTKVPISMKMIKALKQTGLKSIQISLDSIDSDVLKRMVHANDLYLCQMKQTISLLNEEGFKININTIVTSYNSDTQLLENLVSFLSKYENVKTIRFSAVGYSIYKSAEDFLKFRTNDKFINIMESAFLKYLQTEYPHINISFNSGDRKYYYMGKEQKKFNNRATCTGNLRSMIILPDGKVSICEELYNHPQFVIGDVSTNPILDIWNSEKAKNLFYLKKEMISKKSTCKRCEDFDLCRHNKGVCWKSILMAYGYDNWDFPDPRCPHAPELYNEIYADPNA